MAPPTAASDEEPAGERQLAALQPAGAAGAAEEAVKLVGRLRRWNPQGLWGFIFSCVHNCDIYYDGEEDDSEGAGEGAGLTEGDFVLFELKIDEEGSPAAFNARKAKPADIEQLQAAQAPAHQQYAGALQDAGTCPAGHWLEAKAFGWRVTCDACRRVHPPHASMLVCIPCYFIRCPDCSDSSRDSSALSVGNLAAERDVPPSGVPVGAPPRSLPPHLDGHAAAALAGPPSSELLRAEASYAGRQTAGTRIGGGGFLDGYDYRGGGQGQGEAGAGQGARRPIPIADRTFDAQGASARLLLEAPPMLERNFPRAVVSALTTGDRSALRRGLSFPANRSGAAMQIGWEFGRLLRDTREALGQHEEPEGAAAQGNWWSWYSSPQGAGGGGGGGTYGDGPGMPNAALCA